MSSLPSWVIATVLGRLKVSIWIRSRFPSNRPKSPSSQLLVKNSLAKGALCQSSLSIKTSHTTTPCSFSKSFFIRSLTNPYVCICCCIYQVQSQKVALLNTYSPICKLAAVANIYVGRMSGSLSVPRFVWWFLSHKEKWRLVGKFRCRSLLPRAFLRSRFCFPFLSPASLYSSAACAASELVKCHYTVVKLVHETATRLQGFAQNCVMSRPVLWGFQDFPTDS